MAKYGLNVGMGRLLDGQSTDKQRSEGPVLNLGPSQDQLMHNKLLPNDFAGTFRIICGTFYNAPTLKGYNAPSKWRHGQVSTHSQWSMVDIAEVVGRVLLGNLWKVADF